MCLKLVKIIILRIDKVIWSNFKDNPLEDKEAIFIVVLIVDKNMDYKI